MKLTKQGDYAIRAVVELAKHYSGGLCSAKDIAFQQKIPVSFLPKILSLLTKNGIILSQRGSSGGIRLAKSPPEITLSSIVEAVEGPFILNDCLGDATLCERKGQCKVHEIWFKAQNAMLKELNITLDTLI